MSRRVRQNAQESSEEESADEREYGRRISQQGGRTSQGIRTSGLQVPGLPRPGKTTQGQATRRSSEPKKSFGTIRNFWRQLEGGGPDPRLRRPFGRKQLPAKVSRASGRHAQEPEIPKRTSRTSIQRVIVPERRQKSSKDAAQLDTEPEIQEKGSEHKSQSKQSIKDEVHQSIRSAQRMPTIQEEWVSSPRSEQVSHQPEDSADDHPEVRQEGSRRSHRISPTDKAPIIAVEPASDDEDEDEDAGEEDDEDTDKAPEEQSLLRQASTRVSKTSGRISNVGHQSQPRQSGRTSGLSLSAIQEEGRRNLDPRTSLASQHSVGGSNKYGSLVPERTSQRHFSGSIQGRRSVGPVEHGISGFGDQDQPVIAEEPERTSIASKDEGRKTEYSVKLSKPQSFFAPPPPPLPPPAFLKPPSFWHTPGKGVETFRRPSIVLPILLDEEKHFHEMVAEGDIMAVQDFLEKRPNFNLNCSNYQGISALLIAVKAGNEDMTLFLLAQRNLEIGDAHLYAIRDNRPIILRMILDTLQSINPALEFMACAHSAEFAENVTPLILAAQAGHYEIIGILLERGHTIPIPHPPRCFCKEECQVLLLTEDPLSVASGKLHIYRAICNPAYICQTSNDPILTAFMLSKELQTCGQVEQTYLRQYEDLAEATRNFAVDLIAEARSLEEVETIISEKRGINLRGSYMYPRLILAMDLKQKEFVAHPNIQQVLEKTWLGDWVAWKGYRKYIKALYFLPRIVMLPGILIILMFMPTSSWAKYYALPINKLLSNVASYSIFLILVFIQSNVDKTNQTRDTKPTGVEIFLVIYVVSFLYNSLRSLLIEGSKRFFGFMWNLYELIMEILFLLTFIFWIAAAIKTTVQKTKNVERKYWHYMDAELIAEGLFVLASIMAYMKILLICQMSYDLGPLQVSLGKMTNDCAIFSIILGIIILAFTVGLCKFYNYYEGMQQKNPDTGEVDSKQANSFTSVLETFKTLFWGLFGMSSFEVADVVLDNLNDEKGEPTVINEHHFTEAIGYLVFAIYMTLTVIVILNMLIATMSNTFQKVTDNVDIEWAFGRTEVKLSYINKPVMPPPFNIIPTTKGLVDLFKGAKEKAGKITGIGVDVEKGLMEEEKKLEEFSVLMSQLVQRYFSTKSEVGT